MKKFAAILIIITCFINIITDSISINEHYNYDYVGVRTIVVFLFSTIGNIAFILLGFALFNEGNLSNTINSKTTVSQDGINPSETTVSRDGLNPNDVPSTGLNVISFLIPIVGLIIYLTDKDKAPKKASSAGKAALWGVGISILLGVISVIVSIAMVNSMY